MLSRCFARLGRSLVLHRLVFIAVCTISSGCFMSLTLLAPNPVVAVVFLFVVALMGLALLLAW